MAEQKITLIIDEEGTISAKTDGFQGEACIDALEELLDAMTITQVRTTDDYHQKVDTSVKATVKQGGVR